MSDSSTRSSLGSDVSSGDSDWVTYYELESLNLEQKQALGKSLHILKSLIDIIGGEEYDDDEDLRDSALELQRHIWEAETMRVSKQKSFDTHFASKVSTVEIQSLVAKDSGVSRSGDELLPRELFQDSNEKKRSSDIDVEGEADEPQMKRLRTTTDCEDENDSDDSSKNEDLSPEKEADTASKEEEQQRLADEQREQEVARAQREKEELEQQEMAAKKQQRLAAQQHEHDRIEREKEATRVQQQQEVPRRLQQEKEVAEQEKVPKQAEAAKAKDAAAKKADEQKRKEKRERERLARERRKKSKEKKSYTDLIKRSDKLIRLDENETETRPLVAGKTTLIAKLADIVDSMFEKGIDLREVIKNLTCLIGPNFLASSVIASHLSSCDSRTAAIFKRSSNVTIGSLLNSCDDSDDALVGEEDPRIKEEMKRLKLAFEQYNKTVDPSKREKRLNKFVQVGRPTRNTVQHLLNLLLVDVLINGIKLMELVAHLSNEAAEELIHRASELAKEVDPDTPFDKNTITVGSYTNTYVHPGLEDDETWELATSVVISIFDCFTGFVGMTDVQKTTIKNNLDPHYQRTQNCTISGGRDENGVDFFGDGSNTVHKLRRKKAIRSYLVVLLKKAMLRMFPRGLFDKAGGYTRSILRLSPTDIASKTFSFINDSFFGDDNDVSEDVVKRIKAFLNKQKQSDGEITLLIENDDQINSLKRLLAVWLDATSSEAEPGTDETSDTEDEGEPEEEGS